MHCGFDLRAGVQTPSQAAVRPQPVAPPPPGSAPGYAGGNNVPPAFQQAQRNENRNGAIVAIVAVILAIAVGFGAKNLLSKFGTQAAGPSVEKMAKAPDMPSVAKTGTPPPQPNLAIEKDLKKMPPEVREWLEHLAETERRRARLANQGMGKVMAMMPTAQMGMDMTALKALAEGNTDAPEPKTSVDNIQESGQAVRKDWADLMAFFVSKQPPTECVPIANSYHHAVEETGAMIGDIMDSLNKAKDDPQAALQALYGMQNTSKSIDEYGKETDGKVGDICAKYETRKWFSIQADFGNSGLMNAFSK